MADYGLAIFPAYAGPDLACCPFCGGEPHYVQSSFPSGDYKVQVECTHCYVITHPEATRDRTLAYLWAADRWNKRAEGPAEFEEEESDEDNRDGEDEGDEG